ncbi:hypothetical protein BV898_09739 [Hypsibius exemplaris]|uniref:Receptor ligand binding region domain-containing protein n=1 Tax=Hypsibius exemplaris TaxID=2072580 RepID=A0A1W0WLV3_HYPEX|nr:hypothetical protein BV898_09739 [Hypsibius exemplaris]
MSMQRMSVNYVFAVLVIVNSWQLLLVTGHVIHVEIGCPGVMDTSRGVVGALGFTAPAFNEAIEEVNRLYAGIFNFSITYLAQDEEKPPNGEAVYMYQAGSDLVAKWYYTRRRYSEYGIAIDAWYSNMTNGEFVYLTYLQDYRANARWGNLSWQYGDPYDDVARRAFPSLLVVQQYDSVFNNRLSDPESVDFFSNLRRRALAVFNMSYTELTQPKWEIFACHATVLMLAQVLNESFASEGESFLHDAQNLAPRFLNHRFPTRFYDIFLTKAGIQRTRQVVLQMPVNETGMQVVFVEDAENFQLQPTKNISTAWPGGNWPPPNVPRCGYLNDKPICFSSDQAGFISGFTVTSLACILLLAAFFR